MEVNREPAKKQLSEAIKELLDERVYSCDYYNSWEYDENRMKSLELEHKIRKILGEKTWREIFRYHLDIERLDGEMIAGVQESCYRLGFNDGLQLANQLNEAGKGHLNIFN